ncbi:MAG: CRISPR-associated endonuclease Cas1 [Calditrichaeota bacterium]|nr:CRISPR-associated endonuclease Cas1 [Calditrichota bacterium]
MSTESLRVARLACDLTFTRATTIDPYPGSTLHGLVASSVLSYAADLPWPWRQDNERLTAALDLLENRPPPPKQSRPYALAVSEWGRPLELACDETYRFELILLNEGVTWWRVFCAALARRGDDTRARGAFAGNFTLRVHDLLADRALHWQDVHAELAQMESSALQARSDLLRAAGHWTLDLASPLALDAPGRGVLSPSQLTSDHLAKAVAARVSKLGAAELIPPTWPGRDSLTKNLTDAQLQHRITESHEKAEKLWLRGVVGTLTLNQEWEAWLPALCLCELAGLGVNTTYGKGRFALRALAAEQPLVTLTDVANLTLLTAARNQGDGDDLTDREVDDDELLELSRELEHDSYEPQPLRALNLSKASGGVRELSVPVPRDMIVQRALVSLLRPLIESRLEASSYAFRKGRSRYQAANVVDKLRVAGYTHFCRADVDRFFDVVLHAKFENQLQQLKLTPEVIGLVMRCLRADLDIGGRRVQRTKGLPQGAPLSPLLANLYLDGFDEAMAQAGYRLVRFADDFLIAARSEDDARIAGECAARELAKLGLALDADKTSIVSFDQGFTFLGFVFSRSLVLERERHRQKEHVHVALPEESPEMLARATGVETDPLLRSVHVEGYEQRVTNEHDRLVIRREHSEVARLPFSWVREITVAGGAHVSSGVIQRALDLDIPIWFVGRSGQLTGKLARSDSDPSELWLRQQALAQTQEVATRVGQSLVRAKLLNQAAILRRYADVESAVRGASDLRELAAHVYDTHSVPALVGLEGRAAALYFAVWRQLVPEDLNFRARQQRPARDPINVLLNIGYTRLRAQVRGMVERHGLSPFQGFVHQSRAGDTGPRRHDALVSDLMEPFRPLVDRTVLALVRKAQINAAHFTYVEKAEPPCRLAAPGRALYYERWETACRAPVTYQRKSLTLVRALDHFVHDFRDWVARGCVGDIKVFLLK